MVANSQRLHHDCNNVFGLSNSPLCHFSYNASFLSGVTFALKPITSEEIAVDFIIKTFVQGREWHKGQTMTEYALILSAVAVVVYIGYQTMGTNITSLLTGVDNQL